MVALEPFYVEQWMDSYETTAKYNLAETCCASISVHQLLEFSDRPSPSHLDLFAPLTYGEIRGSTQLRTNLSRLYSSKVPKPLPLENILIQPGAIAANYLIFTALIGPGDHVICHHPTYQALYSVPKALGADVDLWRTNAEHAWIPGIEELKQLIKPNTKMIVLNNPQNPTGQVLRKSLLEQIVQVASEHKIIIYSDEVYRPLFHGVSPMDPDFPPTILSMNYENTIATGSLSKAYSLAGIRTGWIASRSRQIIDLCATARHYTTISVGILDQQIAALALSPDCINGLLARNIALCKKNLEILEKFVNRHDEECTWIKPVAGTTAFIRFIRNNEPIDATEFCHRVLDKTGVMLMPGDFGFGIEFQGWVRIGYANHTEVVQEGLTKLREFMRRDYDDVPLATIDESAPR